MIRETIAATIASARRSPMVRLGLLTAVVMLLMVPAIIQGSNRSMDSMFNAPMRWIPYQAESRQEFNRFVDLFGAHEMVLVSWPGCTIDDESLDEVAAALDAIRQRRLDAGLPIHMNQVFTGREVLRQLTDPPIRLSRESALRRLQGVVVGPDGETSCVVVELTDYGAEQRRDAVDAIIQTVTDKTGYGPEDLVLAGPPISGLAIDQESKRSIQLYSIPSVVISLILSWICLRSLWLTIPVVLVGVFGQGLMLAIVSWTGNAMNAILIVLPALVFVLSVSAGVHLVNYFLEGLGEGPDDDAPRMAIIKARGPCLLAAITTAIGLASLSVSTVQPVHDFGILGSIGLLICMGLLFLLVPAFMAIWLKLPGRVTRQTAHASSSHPILAAVSDWVFRHSFAIRATCLALMVCLGAGLIWLRTSIDVMSLLTPDNRAVQNFRWFEDHIGPLVPVEVVVHFDSDCTLSSLERLAAVTAIQNEIDQIESLEGAVSSATFLPPYSFSSSLGSTARRSVIRKRLERDREELVDAKYLADTPSGEAWRISARISATEELDHGEFLQDLQQRVDEVIGKLAEAGFKKISASCTGVEAVSQAVQESLLEDLFNSFLLALVLVGIVMIIALRSVLSGLLAMIPNVFPTLLLFGGMGWIGRAVDIGSVMTASVALGIAVDGTFHFLKWFNHSLRKGQSQREAISVAYQHCGRALVQTTIICASGLLIFSFSDFLPVRQFSLMMMWLLIAALVGDLVLLPALLAGRLGSAMSRNYHAVQPALAVEGSETSSDPFQPQQPA